MQGQVVRVITRMAVFTAVGLVGTLLLARDQLSLGRVLTTAGIFLLLNVTYELTLGRKPRANGV